MQDNANRANLRIKGFRVVGLMDGHDSIMINANNGNRIINQLEMIIVFRDRTQFLVLPAMGFTRQKDGYYLTVGFLTFGITIRIAKFIFTRDD